MSEKTRLSAYPLKNQLEEETGPAEEHRLTLQEPGAERVFQTIWLGSISKFYSPGNFNSSLSFINW